MEDKGEVLYEIGPKFNFFYELTMPTGRKIKSSFTIMIITIIFLNQEIINAFHVVAK